MACDENIEVQQFPTNAECSKSRRNDKKCARLDIVNFARTQQSIISDKAEFLSLRIPPPTPR